MGLGELPDPPKSWGWEPTPICSSGRWPTAASGGAPWMRSRTSGTWSTPWTARCTPPRRSPHTHTPAPRLEVGVSDDVRPRTAPGAQRNKAISAGDGQKPYPHVLRWAGPRPAQAARFPVLRRQRRHRVQPDPMLPPVTEVIQVGQPISRGTQHLITARPQLCCLVRSIAEADMAPTLRSPSQCPGMARSSASAGGG